MTEPNGVGDRVAEGRDYSVYELGNRWDMSDADDLVTTENRSVTGVQFPNAQGTYRATTLNDPRLWLVYPGLTRSVRLYNGERFPIDSTLYRRVAVKLMATGAGPSANTQILFYANQPQGTNTLGNPGSTVAQAGKFTLGQWQVVILDLIDDAGASGTQWTDANFFSGMRLDPTIGAGLDIDIDWVRLVAPASAEVPSEYPVSWTSSGLGGETVDIFAIDDDGALIELADGVPATDASATVDTAVLPPGDFTIRLIASGGLVADSPGVLSVNEAPNLLMLEPDNRGDVNNSYSEVLAGNPWGPFDPGDIDPATTNVTNESFNSPTGAYCAEAINSDAQVVLNTPQPIDSDTYRMLMLDYELEGPRDIGMGSVARLLWRVGSTTYTSEDIIIQEGRNEYVLGDLADVPLEPAGGVPFFWSGQVSRFRFDPHEFSSGLESRRFTLYSMTLAPLDAASPMFLFEWSEVDTDGDATSVELWLDEDRTSANGNETQIAASITPTGAANSFDWQANVPIGQYEVYARISDGLNQVVRYATGPINVTQMVDPGLVFADSFE